MVSTTLNNCLPDGLWDDKIPDHDKVNGQKGGWSGSISSPVLHGVSHI